jgi:DNA-binding HxlR family transcriptional regulator
MTRKKQTTRKVVFTSPSGVLSTTELDDTVLRVIGLVANKWTMCVLEVLEQNGTLRFNQLAHAVGGISQRMLTKTLRQMEVDGFVIRTVYAEVPPKVEYTLTKLGRSLCGAFCSVWTWAEKHTAEFAAVRSARGSKTQPG